MKLKLKIENDESDRFGWVIWFWWELADLYEQ